MAFDWSKYATGGASASADPTLAVIRQFEGFRETPYWDVNAYRTGYGSDTITTADGQVIPVTQDMRVTREDADRDLQRRVNAEFAPIAARAAGDAWSTMTPAQRAALTSIAYNYGEIPSSVAESIRSGGDVAAAIRGLGGHNDGVNRDRRNKEADIYGGAITPDYAGGAASGRYTPPGDVDPVTARNPARLAWAYANGKMTPEDAALYEQGMKEGALPQADAPKFFDPGQQPDPASIYAATAMRPRQPFQPVPLNAGLANATPWRA